MGTVITPRDVKKDYVTLPTAARMLGISRQTLYRYVTDGSTMRELRIKVVRHERTGQYFFQRPSLERAARSMYVDVA